MDDPASYFLMQHTPAGSLDSPENSDAPSDVDMMSSSESDEESVVSTESICETLLKALIKYPPTFAEINLSVSNISKSNSVCALSTALILLETTFSLHPQQRLLVYETLADSVIPHLPQDAVPLPLPRVRAFILRVVGDIEKLSSVEAEPDRVSVPVTKMANLIASMAMLSFADLTVDVLLTNEYIYGKPTIQNVTVQEALIDIFKNRVTSKTLEPNLHSVMVKLANVPSFAINYPVICAIARGIHRCFPTVPENTASLLPIILDTILSSNEGEISTDSLESILLLVSLLDESATASLPLLPQLSHAVLTLGTQGLGTDDLRETFLVAVEVIWAHNVPLFPSPRDVFHLILSITDEHSIWQLYPGDEATIFLCELITTPKTPAIRIESAIQGLTQIAIRKKELLNCRVLDLIESFILSSQEHSFPVSPQAMIFTLDLVSEIAPSLIIEHPLIVQFLLQIVLYPSTIINEKFPEGLASTQLSSLRKSGSKALVSFCVRLRECEDEQEPTPLVGLLLESIEHMPSRGVGILSRCLSSLLSPSTTLSIPDPQAIVVVIWMLISFHITRPSDEQDADLREDISAGFTAISSLLNTHWEINETEPITSQFVQFIDTFSAPDRTQFLNNCLDTIVSILSSTSTVPEIRNLLIQLWSVTVHEFSDEESVSKAVNQLLDLTEVITCSRDCIETTGKVLGEFLTDQNAGSVLECFRERFAVCDFQLHRLGGAPSSLLNGIRLSKKSLRGLFTTEASERQIKTWVRVREILIIAFSKLKSNEWVKENLLDELEREHDAILNYGDQVLPEDAFETTKTILCAVGDFSLTDPQDIVFCIESCADMLQAVKGSSVLAGPLLTCIASLLAADVSEISPELFSEVLERTLQAIVETVPDNALLLNSLSSESHLLTERCTEAALVMKALFHQTSLSWVGLNRLVKAIYALGGGGALPLIRWVCVRIISIVIDDGGLVDSDQDAHELLDILAVLLGRLDDSYSPVRLEANRAVVNLLLRWKVTSEDLKGVATLPSLVQLLTRKIPPALVSSFTLGLISNVHDLDASAAEGTVNAIHSILENRSAEMFADENSAADAVVDAIMLNASQFPSPPAPPSHWTEIQSRLVSTLRFIAAVRFQIAIKDILTPLDDNKTFSIDKIQAIRSFILEKKTLAFFIKELITRLNSGDGRTATVALGHLLDCYKDSSVASVATKNFSELYCSLLVALYHETDQEQVRIVIQKLARAAGNAAVAGESVTTENGLLLYRNSDKIIENSAKFIAPFLISKNRLVPHTLLTSQLVGTIPSIDIIFLEFFENVCENYTVRNPVEVVHSLRGLGRIVSRWIQDRDDSLEDTDSHSLRMLTCFNNLIVCSDSDICLEALKAMVNILKMATHSGEMRTYFLHPVLGQLRRVVDHPNEVIRRTVFELISGICQLMDNSDELDDDSVVVECYRSVSDLWIPCVVRTQDPADEEIGVFALQAFTSILNFAVRETPTKETTVSVKDYSEILKTVKSEIGECSFVHLNACCYYLLGLPSVANPVRVAAARLVPVILSMIPEPSGEAINSVVTVINSMLSSGIDQLNEVVADILIEARRVDTSSEGTETKQNDLGIVVT